MAYDVAGFDRFTKSMRSYARAQDADEAGRVAARARRREAQATYRAQHNRLRFRRTPATAEEALAQAQDPPSVGGLAAEHARRQLVAVQRDADALAGRLPANLHTAADAYHRRWLAE